MDTDSEQTNIVDSQNMADKLRPEPIWELSAAEYEAVVKSIRPLDEIDDLTIFFRPGEYGHLFSPQWEIDKGMIAICDADRFLDDSHWYLIHALCYMQYLKDPNEKVVITRKYLEPSYLTIYSSLECLAKAIEILLAIDMTKYKGKKMGDSLFSKIGCALKNDYKDAEITKISQNFFENANISKIVSFRHAWVHNQRIQLKDEALPILREQTFWKKDNNSYEYRIESIQRSHNYDINEYSEIIISAFNAYYDYFKETLLLLKDHICKKGNITFSVEKKADDNGITSFNAQIKYSLFKK